MIQKMMFLGNVFRYHPLKKKRFWTISNRSVGILGKEKKLFVNKRDTRKPTMMGQNGKMVAAFGLK